MKLYVANLTKQVQEFVYRLPERSSAYRQTIPIGSQIAISGELSPRDIDEIIKHHSKYGMVSVKEIDRTKPFIGTCYSDKPIPISSIMHGIQHNADVLVGLGKEIREQSAVTVNDLIERNLMENPGLEAGLRHLEMSVVEQQPTGGFRGESKPIAEGVRVKRGGRGGEGSGRGRGRRAA